MMKKVFRVLLKAVIVIVIIIFITSLFAPRHKGEAEYGVTFSYPYAESLGLDWKQVYGEMLEDLNVKRVRIPVYWNKAEPRPGEFNFDEVDYQLDMAEKHGAKVVLAVGRRVPRWPECHEPEWVKDLSSEGAVDNALLSFVETVTRRYYAHPAVEVWQVENEPFLSVFGICPRPRAELLDREIEVVKKIDPSRPVLITDSGELSLWLKAGKRGDMFGTTLYRYVFSDVFKRYWVNYIPSWFYRFKGGYLSMLNPGKKMMIIELQAEPWTTNGILQTPIEEQFRTMSMKKFNKLISVSDNTGFSPQYLWGVEWWYWMKTQNHPEFWDRAEELFNN